MSTLFRPAQSSSGFFRSRHVRSARPSPPSTIVAMTSSPLYESATTTTCRTSCRRSTRVWSSRTISFSISARTWGAGVRERISSCAAGSIPPTPASTSRSRSRTQSRSCRHHSRCGTRRDAGEWRFPTSASRPGKTRRSSSISPENFRPRIITCESARTCRSTGIKPSSPTM